MKDTIYFDKPVCDMGEFDSMRQIKLSSNTLLLLDLKPDRETAKMELWYSHGGSWYEPEFDRGRRHLLEHCLVSRTKDLNETQFREYCFAHNIQYNAFTSPSVINLSAKSHRDDVLIMARTMAELYFAPTFTEDVLNSEREIVLRELADRTGDPDYTLWKDITAQIFTHDSLEAHEVLGEEEAVASTQLTDFHRMYDQIRQDSTTLISISGGGISEESILNELQKYTIPDHQVKDLPHTFRNKLAVTGFQPIHHSLAHQAATISLIIPMHVTFANRPLRGIFSELFLGWNGSGLYDYLRDERGLVYGYNFAFDEPGQFLRFDLNCELRLVTVILDAIYEYFNDFNKCFREEKFDVLKKVTLKKFQQNRDSIGFDPNFLVNNILYYNEYENSFQYEERIKATTVKEIEAMYNSIRSSWLQSTAIVTSRDEGVKSLSYEFR